MGEIGLILSEYTEKLTQPTDREALLALHEKLMDCGYKMQSKHRGAGFGLKYSIKSRKPLLAVEYKKNKNSGFEIHLRPLHVAQYAHRLGELSEHIRDCCLGGRDCGRCGYCDKAYVFEYAGAVYTKCQFICYNFCFTELQPGDGASILRVLEMELACI